MSDPWAARIAARVASSATIRGSAPTQDGEDHGPIPLSILKIPKILSDRNDPRLGRAEQIRSRPDRGGWQRGRSQDARPGDALHYACVCGCSVWQRVISPLSERVPLLAVRAAVLAVFVRTFVGTVSAEMEARQQEEGRFLHTGP